LVYQFIKTVCFFIHLFSKPYLDQKFSNFETRFEEKFDKIDQQFDKVNQRLDRIENDVTDLKVGQVRLEGELKRVEVELKGQVERVEEKIDGLDKRLEFQEFINCGVLIGFIVAILAGLAKLFGFVPNSP
jgi:predicted nuclease with TOPRIM domain